MEKNKINVLLLILPEAPLAESVDFWYFDSMRMNNLLLACKIVYPLFNTDWKTKCQCNDWTHVFLPQNSEMKYVLILSRVYYKEQEFDTFC